MDTAGEYDLVVIGGGPGGYGAALYATSAGLKVAVVEKDPMMGGTCLNRGCIPAKSYLEAAAVHRHVAHAGDFGIETIGKFLKGEHPWLAGHEGFYLLSLLAVTTSFGTGLWIGYTSKGRAILEGVLVGAAVTVITATTNMLILYRKIEEVANQMAASMGYGMRIGFVAVLTVQVLLYGLWAGIAEKAKMERANLAAIRKAAKKPRK